MVGRAPASGVRIGLRLVVGRCALTKRWWRANVPLARARGTADPRLTA